MPIREIAARPLDERSSVPAAQRDWPQTLRASGTAAALAAGLAFYVWVIHGHVPLQDWLFWHYALYWVLAAIWSTSCVAIGHVITRRVLRVHLPFAEAIALSFGVGLFAFFAAMFAGGLVGAWGSVFFAAVPLAFLAIGGPSLARTLRRRWRHVRAAAGPTSPGSVVAIVFGVLVLGMLYFLVLSPANISFDARWKHLAIAEHYVELGRVAPFAEGWYPGTAPHLASFLYAWAFLIPGRDLAQQLGLAAHLEFAAFLWTLVGIPALVRRVLPDARAGVSWVARFLFPGVLLYDSNPSVGSDHLAAAFAVPIALLTFRAWRDLRPSACVLLAVMLAGGVLTKYSSAISLVLFPVLAVAVRMAWLGARRLLQPAASADTRFWLAGPLAALVAGLACTAPHWLKNWVFYGDPLYPVMHERFASTPWAGDAAQVLEYGYLAQLWAPTRDWAGVQEALAAVLSFSFVPNDWASFHRDLPVFGSLLTLLSFCLPFVRARPALWALFGMIHLGVFCWYWVHHQDRHLQTLVPLMAAATAAGMILVWRSGRAARAVLCCAVAAQLIWAGDAYFFPTHSMAKSPIRASSELVASTFTGSAEQRIRGFERFAEVRAALPDDAVVLLHDGTIRAGIGAPVVSDHQGWQAGISYGHLHSPGAIWDALREMGVTHAYYQTGKSRGWDSLAGDVAIFDFLERLEEPRRMRGHVLGRLPAERPAGQGPEHVYVHACGKTWAPGLYGFEQLRVPAFGPPRESWPAPLDTAASPAARAALIERADFVIADAACDPLPAGERQAFVRVATRKLAGDIPSAYEPGVTWTLWRRRPPVLDPAAVH